MLRPFLSRFFSAEAKPAHRQRKFVDKCRVVLRAGNGGKGCLSHVFMSSRSPKTADGGNGGNGGNVILRAISSSGKLDSLNLDSYHVNAGNGTNGSGNAKAGRSGKTSYLNIPVGTVAREILPEEEWSEEDWERFDALEADARHPLVYGRVIDMCEPGQEYMAVHGGRGGLGNISRDPRKVAYGKWKEEQKNVMKQEEEKARNAANRLKRGKGEKGGRTGDVEEDDVEEDIVNEVVDDLVEENRMEGTEDDDDDEVRSTDERHVSGTPGEHITWELELKTIADVGLVGFPNAGKSTLLSCLSRARPKVAAYPFTTLHPYVGVTEFRDGKRISVADIPGLVEGAGERNAGLGHSFLRHIERTGLLCYVVDVGRCVSEEGLTPLNDLEALISLNASIDRATHQLNTLVYELEAYAPGLSQRPSIVVANKMDTLIVPEQYDVEERLSSLGYCVSHDVSTPLERRTPPPFQDSVKASVKQRSSIDVDAK